MSAIFTAAEHGADALRRIGTYAPTHAGADPDELEIALISLDKLLAELAATNRAWWLVPQDIVAPLAGGVNPTDIVAAAGLSVLPANTLQFITDAKLIVPSTGQESDLERLSRREYRDIDNRSTTGLPEKVYIDRTLRAPLAYTYPVQTDATWSLRLTIQKYHPDVSQNKAQLLIEAGWNRWIEYALASDLGSGPILYLDQRRIDSYRLVARDSREGLLAFQNREAKRTPPLTVFNDF